MKYRWLVLLFLWLCAGCSNAVESITSNEPIVQAHTKVDLLSVSENINPGGSLWVGVRMKIDPQWHVYWKNPGDSGLAPTIRWDLPPGFAAGEIYWPYPKVIRVASLAAYGYEDEVVFFVPIRAASLIEKKNIVLNARIDWLACKVECIPGRADLSLELPVVKGEVKINFENQKIFTQTKERWPFIFSKIEIEAYEQEDNIFFEIGPAAEIKPGSQIYFFPDRGDVIDHAAEQALAADENVFTLTVKKSSLLTKPLDSISGVLLNSSGWGQAGIAQGIIVDKKVKHIDPPFIELASSPVPENLESPPFAAQISLSIWIACFFAFLGGLILNLMPCVLPVLSLKVLHLVAHSRQRKKAFLNGLSYAAGIIVSFWVLVVLLLILRSLGSSVGWGFQFQSSGFVVFIAMLLFVFALNLFGLFEVGSSLTRLGNISVNKKGVTASFLSGALATVVATPCTAPFMGTALSYALSRESWESFLVFTFLGAGLALPVVVLSCFPKLLKWIPKPGAWMNTFKAILGFILLASVIWLVWVLGQQKAIGSVILLLSAFLLMSLGLYLYGKNQLAAKKSFLKTYNIFLIIVCGLFVAWSAAAGPAAVVDSSRGKSSSVISWKKYSAQLVERLKGEQKAVFLDFTAAWCLSCQVNDRVALNDASVAAAFEHYSIEAVKADWTNNDPAIAKALALYGRNSIPLYVLYPGNGQPPVFLPEVLTPKLVIEFLENNIKPKQ